MSESEVHHGIWRKQEAGREGWSDGDYSNNVFITIHGFFMPGIATGRRRSGAAPVARGHESAAAERHPRRVSDLRQEIRQRQDTTAHGGARAFNLAIRACARIGGIMRRILAKKRVHPTLFELISEKSYRCARRHRIRSPATSLTFRARGCRAPRPRGTSTRCGGRTPATWA